MPMAQGFAPAVMPMAPWSAPAVVPFDAASAPAVVPIGPGPAPDAAPAVTLVSDGSGLDFLGPAKPAASTGKPRPIRPKGWSAILHNPVIRFYLIGSLVLLVVVGVLLYLSNKPPARRGVRKPAVESPAAEQAETRPDEKAVAADSEPAPAPAKAERFAQPKFTTGKPTFGETDPLGTSTVPAKGKSEPAGKPTFLEKDPLGTMIAPAKEKPEPAAKPTFLETDPLGTMIGGKPAVVDDKPASTEPDPFAPKPAASKAKPAPKQSPEARPGEPKPPAAAKPAAKQSPKAKPGKPQPPAAAKLAPEAESKIDSQPAPSSPKKGP
jgi:hypothetical protein